jgi:hypothetical protein
MCGPTPAIDLTLAAERPKRSRQATVSRSPPRPAPTASSAASRCAGARPARIQWAVFALANTGDEQLDRLIVVPHYRMVGPACSGPISACRASSR